MGVNNKDSVHIDIKYSVWVKILFLLLLIALYGYYHGIGGSTLLTLLGGFSAFTSAYVIYKDSQHLSRRQSSWSPNGVLWAIGAVFIPVAVPTIYFVIRVIR